MRLATPRSQAGKVKLTLILIVVAAVLLASGATVAGLYFGGMIGGHKAPQAAAAEKGGKDAKNAKDAKAKAAAEKPPIYFAIEPALVVNLPHDGEMGFLQADLQIMTREPQVVDKVKTHMPVIRNDLLLLLGNQKYQSVITLAGKEALRKESLATINNVLAEEHVHGRVDAVYFTGFVMQ